MSEEEKPKKDPDKKKLVDDQNKLVLKLGDDDSALVVRTNGEIELISRDLEGKEDNYLGDLEDLNKTFTLVLAFAAALENEQLYNGIFQNLNHVLHRQWDRLPPEEKTRIKDIRMHHLLNPDEDDKKDLDTLSKSWKALEAKGSNGDEIAEEISKIIFNELGDDFIQSSPNLDEK